MNLNSKINSNIINIVRSYTLPLDLKNSKIKLVGSIKGYHFWTIRKTDIFDLFNHLLLI